jgi:hypothetical protein
MTFDEVEIVRPVDEAPDLSDLALVTLNAETSDGRQYSMVWTAEKGSLSIIEDGYYTGPAGTKWTFTLNQAQPS